MLLNNYGVIFSNPGREIGGISNPIPYAKASTYYNFFIGESEVVNKDSFPSATEPPYAYSMAIKGGLLSASTSIVGEGDLDITSLSLGINVEGAVDGQGDLAASMSLIVQMACDILLSSNLSASMTGKVEMASALAGAGNLTASLGLLAGLSSTVDGQSTLVGGQRATLSLEADITSSSTLSPESLAAAVWSALAASFNNPGTMGAKLNSAASAGDPWSTILPGAYVDGEAGKILSQIQTLADELHKLQGLNPDFPATTTKTSRTAGDISLTLTGEENVEVTVTRDV